MLAEIFGVDGIVVVAVLAVLLFGGAAIPKLAEPWFGQEPVREGSGGG